ncbi:glycosyl hydrolase family 65 protein [Enterococcus faecium]|uniref:glycosyl hydrolase family 65 protein n=1 Tax=Enterococcus faecium TaxID=1352 RepID=UPI0035DE0B28
MIDLGPDPHSSDDGIHAASLGALWLAVIFGFSGITVTNGTLSISPRLPSAWEKISFPFIWKNHRLLFVLTKKQIVIKKETKETLPIFVNEDQYQLEKELILERREK